MTKKSNLNLYDNTDGNKFNICVTHEKVLVSSSQKIHFPDIQIGSIPKVSETITRLQNAVAAEKTERESAASECMRMCNSNISNAVAAEKTERESAASECMRMCNSNMSNAVAAEKTERESAVKAVNARIDEILEASPEQANSLHELLKLIQSGDNTLQGLVTNLTNRIASLENQLNDMQSTVSDLTNDP